MAIDPNRTTTTLLEGLFDQSNDEAWSLFDARYRPILVGFGRRVGLDDADAADMAQETLARFVKEYREGRYDRSRARLRSWLIGIARYRIATLRRNVAGRREYRGDSAVVDLQDEATITRIWEEQRRTIMLQEALGELRRTTRTSEKVLMAFEMLTVRQMPVQAVAEALEMSAQDVYLAKSRVAQRLREILSRLEASHDEED